MARLFFASGAGAPELQATRSINVQNFYTYRSRFHPSTMQHGHNKKTRQYVKIKAIYVNSAVLGTYLYFNLSSTVQTLLRAAKTRQNYVDILVILPLWHGADSATGG